MRSSEYSTARLRLALLLSIPLVFSLIFFAVNTSAEHNDIRLVRLQDLHAGIGSLRATANDAEVGEHGFLLTSDERYIATLDNATHNVISKAKSVRKIPVDKDLQPKLDRFIALVKQRVFIANEVIQIQRNSGLDAAVLAVRGGDGETAMSEVRAAADV